MRYQMSYQQISVIDFQELIYHHSGYSPGYNVVYIRGYNVNIATFRV